MANQLFIPKWSEDQSVRVYKSLIWNRINEVTNLPFDQPGGSGTTSTGNMAKIFFSYKNHVFQLRFPLYH